MGILVIHTCVQTLRVLFLILKSPLITQRGRFQNDFSKGKEMNIQSLW